MRISNGSFDDGRLVSQAERVVAYRCSLDAAYAHNLLMLAIVLLLCYESIPEVGSRQHPSEH